MRRAIRKTGRFPDPATPVTIEDKFLWRKIFDRNPLFVIACDKIASKRYVQSVVQDLKAARVIWVGKDARQIPDDALAGNVVVKSSQGSGSNLMVVNGQVDYEVLYKEADRWMSHQYGRKKGEWGYSGVERYLLVEEMLTTNGQPVGEEYKFHICGGRTAYVFVRRQHQDAGEEILVLNRDGEVMAQDNATHLRAPFVLPPGFRRMRDIAEKLAEPFDFIRCDLYCLDNEIYFSELTVYPSSGYGYIQNESLMNMRNEMWDLRKSWFLTVPQRGWRRFFAAALLRWLDIRAAKFARH